MACSIKDNNLGSKTFIEKGIQRGRRTSKDIAIEQMDSVEGYAYVPSKQEVKIYVGNLIKENVIKNFNFENTKKEQDKVILNRLSYVSNDRALAIGKRLILINNELFGPTDVERSGIGFVISNTEIDRLRFESRRYWKTDDNGKYLLYAWTNNKNSPYIKQEKVLFDFVNFNLQKSEAIKCRDVRKILDPREMSLSNAILTKTEIKRSQVSEINSNTQTIANSIRGEKQGSQSLLINASTQIVAQVTQTQKKYVYSGDLVFRDVENLGNINEPETLFCTKQWVLIKRSNNLSSTTTKARKIDRYTLISSTTMTIAESNINVDSDKTLWELQINGGIGKDQKVYLPLLQEKFYYYDYAFELDLPFSSKEIKNFNGINKPLIAQIVPEYNFEIQNYEQGIKNINEILIPNMYVISSEIRDDVKSQAQGTTNANTYFDKVITMNGVLDPTPFRMKMGKQIADINAIDITGEYYDNYALKIKQLYSPRVDTNEERKRIDELNNLLNLDSRLKYIGIPISNVGILNEFYDKKELFPMYTDIQFSTDRTTQLAQIIKDSKLNSVLTNNLMKSDNTNSGFDKKKFLETTEYIEEAIGDNGSIQLNKKYSFERNDRRVWNITTWMKDFDEQDNLVTPNQVLNNVQDIGVFLDQETKEITLNNNPNYDFFKNLMRIIFIGKMRKLIQDKFRTYEDMINGKLAYSETVLYRVEKKLADRNGKPTGDVIQNFYFPNANEIDILKFVDTQVKYGVPYAYSVYAYQAVIGTRYHYDDLTLSDEAFMAYFQVTQEPYILLVEVPYYQFSGAIVDDPPVYPDINMIPYRGIDNELLIWCNGGTGELWQDPIIIEPQEKEIIDLFRSIKGYDKKEKIRYKSDDFIGVFQIYRIDYPPESYSDFASNLLLALSSDYDITSDLGANSSSFIDRIRPNKKYWYCFRAVDHHGHFSNPSPVMQVQMINNKGTIFPLIEEYQFQSRKKKEISKTLRKYLYIAPKLSQTLVNEKKMGIEDNETVRDVKNVYLGVAEQDLWGKNYLIRITSKNTGKIIELNVNFDHKFNRSK